MSMKPLDTVLLNPTQVASMKEDLQGWKGMVNAVNQGHWMGKGIQDVQAVRERIQRTEHQLRTEAASEGDLTGHEKDTLAKQEVELRTKITQGMLPEETMRKCPSNAPSDLLRWEAHNIKDIEKWKNIRQQLDPLNPEAQNLEVYRPRGERDVTRIADESVIPGKMNYTTVSQEKWDATFDPSQKVLSALDRHEILPRPIQLRRCHK